MTEPKKPIKKPRGKACLLEGKCIACGARCQSSCPVNAIEMNEAGEPIIDLEKCIGCVKCVKVCPVQAIEMFFTPEEQRILDELAGQGAEAPEEVDEEEARLAQLLAAYRGVWVFVEQTEGEVAKVSWELLGKGRELADALGVELAALVIGHGVEHLCQEAFCHGADKAYLVNDPVYRHYRTESYLRAVCHLVER
ncbi:MAG TPA: 4Fe-4S dicluster domain-containing protein, partial [Geobacteraceae bacterium]